MRKITVQYLIKNLNELPNLAKKSELSTKSVFKKLKKKKPKDLDTFVHGLHEGYFSEVDCLVCGNCCRRLGPRFSDRDIERLAKRLRQKPSVFVQKYLRIDEDNDYVFQSMPCPFLGEDNYCFVYEDRPKACREYPHTDRKNFIQILDISLKNCETCPVVFKITEDICAKYGNNGA